MFVLFLGRNNYKGMTIGFGVWQLDLVHPLELLKVIISYDLWYENQFIYYTYFLFVCIEIVWFKLCSDVSNPIPIQCITSDMRRWPISFPFGDLTGFNKYSFY